MEDVKIEVIYTPQEENTFANIEQEEEMPENFDGKSEAGGVKHDDSNEKLVAAINSQVGVNEQSLVEIISTGDGLAVGRKETNSFQNLLPEPSTSRSPNNPTRPRKRRYERYYARMVIPRESKTNAISMIRALIKGKSQVAPMGVLPKRKKRSEHASTSKKQVLKCDCSSCSSCECICVCRDCGKEH